MKLDLNLLKRLLVIDHPSREEWPMLSTIINECYKIGNLEFELDSYCNIFITKNTSNPDFYPCVVAHTDCVLPHENKSVKIKNGIITGRNSSTGKQIGLGMDDVNGICVALQLLKVVPNLKVCFTTEEEVGYNGADAAANNISFFHDVSYLIQADRHGSSDLITFTNFIYSASDTFLERAMPAMLKYGYKEETGIGTDIGVLAEKLELSGVNVSCGYYKEHSDKEYTVISELQNCLSFIYEILTTVPLDIQYEIKIDYCAYNSYHSWNGRFDYGKRASNLKIEDDYPKDDYYEDIPCNKCRDYDCMNCPYGDWWSGSNK